MPKATKPDPFEIKIYGKPETNLKDEFTPAEISRYLAVLPKTIYAYATEAKNAQKALKMVQHDAKKTRAKIWLQSVVYKKAHPDELSSEGDRRAWVENHEEVINADVAEIVAQSDYEIAVLKAEFADRWFTAVRKAANLIEMQEKATMRDTRYAQN